MKNRRPLRLMKPEHRHEICVVCEGAEEEAYLRRLTKLGVWDNQYKFKIVNAKATSNIPSAYEYHCSLDRFELVLVLYDTDEPPCRVYGLVKEKIARTHEDRSEAPQSVIMFANPCMMQIILLHFADNVVLAS